MRHTPPLLLSWAQLSTVGHKSSLAPTWRAGPSLTSFLLHSNLGKCQGRIYLSPNTMATGLWMSSRSFVRSSGDIPILSVSSRKYSKP